MRPHTPWAYNPASHGVSRISGSSASPSSDAPVPFFLHSTCVRRDTAKDFIPLAEQTGLIIPIEKFVLRKALEQMRLWKTGLASRMPLTVSVNLSAKHYSEPNLVEDIERILNSTRVDPRCLKL